MLLLVTKEVQPHVMASQSSYKHHISRCTPSHPGKVLATIVPPTTLSLWWAPPQHGHLQPLSDIPIIHLVAHGTIAVYLMVTCNP